jgi:cation:H+ antiporter
MLLMILLLLAGFAILVKGADFLVTGASSLAKRYGISNLTIGLTVVAFGTSMPELIVSLIAALNGQHDASFGNVIGSNNLNILFILGVAGIICPLVVQKNTVKFEVPFSLFAAIILFVLVNDAFLWGGTNQLSRVDSLILIVCFGAFLMYIYRMMKRTGETDEGGAVKQYGIGKSSGMVVAGLAMLIGGGKVVVDQAVAIAHTFGLSEKLIGLTILAAGTSLPELATSAVAAYRRNADIAVGNVVGSNIFNIFFILSVTGLVSPISYNAELNTDLYVLCIATGVLILFMFTLNRNRLDRWEAVLFLLGYVAYTVYLVRLEN